MMAAESAAGTLARASESGGGVWLSWAAMTAWAEGPLKGGCPASIS
jgi:hypothetical protein